MINVNDQRTLTNYLLDRGICSPDQTILIEPISGGVSNSVLKITNGDRRFVLKQALHKLKVQADWTSDIRRSIVEKNALKYLGTVLPHSVPRFVYDDGENYLFMMSCAPDSAVTWKSQLMAGELNDNVADLVGRTLGAMHQITHEHPEAVDRFRDKKFFYELRIAPYFQFLKKKHGKLERDLTRHIESCMETELALVTADYSPKNILVDGEQIVLIDFEVSHYGDPSFDLGFLCTHLVLKSVKFRDRKEHFLRLIRRVIQAYFSEAVFMDRSELEARAVQQLGWIVLARVDGKSPVEYLTTDAEKQSVRRVSYGIIENRLRAFHDVIQFQQQEWERPI